MLEHAHAIVGYAVKEQDPIAGGFRRAHFPSAKNAAIGSAHVEVFAVGVVLREGDIRLLDEFWRKRALHRMQEPWRNDPAGYRGDERREDKELEKEAGRAAHSH